MVQLFCPPPLAHHWWTSKHASATINAMTHQPAAKFLQLLRPAWMVHTARQLIQLHPNAQATQQVDAKRSTRPHHATLLALHAVLSK
jgi:hypothetical protein